MKCLQCPNEANETESINGYSVRECSLGHRSAVMNAAQQKEYESKMKAVDSEENGMCVLKGKKVKKSRKTVESVDLVFDQAANGDEL